MTIFRHVVGKSTLAEGMAVPKELEEWICAPAVNEKREIKLIFEGGEAKATLRRLANARGHVQIKYENRCGLPFRDWLRNRFAASENLMEGQYLEIVRIDGDTFRVNAFPSISQPTQRLAVAEWIFHRTSQRVFETHEPVREIPAIIQSVEFNAEEGQDFYNRRLSHFFEDWNWEPEKQVIGVLPLKSDFTKGQVQVEVEFGNARTYYQDYIKFLLAFNCKATQVGVLVVPTEGFARTLCAVGRKRAIAKGRHSYSGMIHIEKVRRELEYLAFMLKMPLAIAGIDVQKLR